MDHTADAHPWLVALEQSGLGAAMRQSLLLYPAVEILHIFGFVVLAGSILGFDLRVLGIGRHLPLAPFARLVVPLSALGFAIAVPCGFLLFVTEATSIAANPAFQAKLACIAIGLINIALFHLGPWRSMAAWGAPGGLVPPAAKLGAVVSLLAWSGAIIGGRLIAYL
ncbi:MAG: hypothetical protein ACK4FK_14815 [Ferrovibrio sp.]|jgi:hypothetical protein|uniref:hypothetical protein n=1 Tax=Ferrovibrio sp. TaxID=1917215 RepID=UPI003919EBDF